MIKTLMFDNCGVITTGDPECGYRNIAEFLGISEDKLIPVWENLGTDLDEGLITTEDFHIKALMALGVSKDVAELRKVHLRSYYVKEDVKDLVELLKHSYGVVLLTNFGDAFDECNQNWKLDKIFGDKIFVSAKLKMRKPNEDIYKYILEKLSLNANETVFIDDNIENIQTSRNIGMSGILFESLDQLKKDLRELL
ncbi:TPA: hypothetical protein DDW69_01185 [candidate division CPR2 bacterium]|uniref:HAD hydrolase, family IA, variant 3 n=1 Tax=candidate division CPR2 bacterium GW2011_GWC1_41_48 TaxID=1618344 RepID=A0A0G0Z9E2_UNCC2|nr:MAG: HAD hydrolase, family IA, variant 3 [candidate division CPR2 bacterium GW2011_GWC2_39_35]KKR29483.1 MAG: HAD hydrolase, family IA, variant 3 [candidate division CPR2 bacterium GW2011_GWD2_39_7]KKR29708.1 MAG: HAD hydrolase, family IA, variant 3 [candidate division CPR2 bacterium GW2011_GWD1_39_7]KKS09638.1 MAG: HAD hydrolase, family IA, variant 3 [candidate division CPR2 bacterium GW2011_GWC1_41_48]OGB59493.1 MAG: hypothetical protein A2Y27_00875 [candidate division CPR2 bacterium GWD1_